MINYANANMINSGNFLVNSTKARFFIHREQEYIFVNFSDDEYTGCENSGSLFIDFDSLKSLLERPHFQTIKESSDQINELKNNMGFNISEIATILHVRRPTVYEWLKAGSTNLHENNRKRLDELYDICEKWMKTGLGRLGPYLRKSIVDNNSLFDLLSCEEINHSLIDKAFSSLEKIIEKANKEKELDGNFVTKYGLEENTRKHKVLMRKRHRSIG